LGIAKLPLARELKTHVFPQAAGGILFVSCRLRRNPAAEHDGSTSVCDKHDQFRKAYQHTL
jgi:hypothetical protein